MDVVFQTRFSFFGQSGWKGAAAADPALLFAPDRLERRMRYFEMITLPSLADQTDPGFRHMVLSSAGLPILFQRRLRDLVLDTLGAERAEVLYEPPGSAGKLLAHQTRARYRRRPVAQVVLDDDDAVSNDFVEMVRYYGQVALDDPHNPDDYAFLSFPRGYSLGIERGQPAWLASRFVNYTNLGLALVAPGNSGRSPFATSHRKIGQRHPSLLLTHNRPYYLRAVHEHNDSNAYANRSAIDGEDAAAVLRYFPFLARHVRMAPRKRGERVGRGAPMRLPITG